MRRKLILVLVALGAALAVASAGEAAAPQVCPSFKTSGFKLNYETLGHSWTCSAAKAWIVKFAAEHVAASDLNVPIKNGPAGYHCLVTPRKQNLAISGTCFKGTLAYPGTGFAWLPA